MNDQIDNAKEAIFTAASNPKVATFVAAGAGATGVASRMEIITGWMGFISVTLGMCTAAVVLTIQVIKLVKEWRSYRQEDEI
jgi:threonine/homoserine/homoserine lactone efflux protein